MQELEKCTKTATAQFQLPSTSQPHTQAHLHTHMHTPIHTLTTTIGEEAVLSHLNLRYLIVFVKRLLVTCALKLLKPST